MPADALSAFEPRKTPVQTRAAVTVEAISEATIQVLLSHGGDRLTTTRVAERAGVSVGTLYQYYPNKESLLFAVLQDHLEKVTMAVEAACEQARYRPLADMIRTVVEAFVDAKLSRTDISVALYQIAANPAKYANDFFDVTLGNNQTSSIPGYSASTGWDAVTGLGTPNVANLIPDLIAATP